MRFAHYRAAMLRVWGMATQLQCALPLDTSLPASHLAKLHLICDNQASNQKQLYKAMASKIASLESTKWNPQQLVKSKKEEMHRKDKRELQGQLAKNNKKATAYLKETSDAVKEAQELLQAQTKPTYGSVRLIVTLDERQRLKQVRKLATNSSTESATISVAPSKPKAKQGTT